MTVPLIGVDEHIVMLAGHRLKAVVQPDSAEPAVVGAKSYPAIASDSGRRPRPSLGHRPSSGHGLEFHSIEKVGPRCGRGPGDRLEAARFPPVRMLLEQ